MSDDVRGNALRNTRVLQQGRHGLSDGVEDVLIAVARCGLEPPEALPKCPLRSLNLFACWPAIRNGSLLRLFATFTSRCAMGLSFE